MGCPPRVTGLDLGGSLTRYSLRALLGNIRRDSALPGAAGLRLDRGITHPGETRVVRRRRWRWLGCPGCGDQVGAGGGVGFARFLHARAHEALEAFCPL